MDSIYTSELGEGWAAAILDTEGEFQFIKEGQRTFHHSRSYYIGGSTSSSLNTYIDYSQYNLDNTGSTKSTWLYHILVFLLYFNLLLRHK